MADIGTHAENLAEYITGLQITELCADLTTFVAGRMLDDDGNVLLRFDKGAKGSSTPARSAPGKKTTQHPHLWGKRRPGMASEQPNSLIVKWLDRPLEVYRAGTRYLSERARIGARLPAGHPEGFIEAFANIYRNFLLTLKARLEQRNPVPSIWIFLPVRDGVRGMAFIATVVESAHSDRKWTKLKTSSLPFSYWSLMSSCRGAKSLKYPALHTSDLRPPTSDL